MAATLDGIAGYLNLRGRSEVVKKLMLWGLEALELGPKGFPEFHPSTGRSQEEVFNNPKTGRARIFKQGNGKNPV